MPNAAMMMAERHRRNASGSMLLFPLQEAALTRHAHTAVTPASCDGSIVGDHLAVAPRCWFALLQRVCMFSPAPSRCHACSRRGFARTALLYAHDNQQLR